MSELVTRYRSDPRKAAIQRAVNVIAEAIFARDIHISEVVAALTTAKGDATTPRESAAAVRQSQHEKMVAELTRLEQEGRGRASAMLVARKFAGDPLDPIEVESIARKLRRWRSKKFGHCPVAADENG
jgi:hypothetical protein